MTTNAIKGQEIMYTEMRMLCVLSLKNASLIHSFIHSTAPS